MFKNCEYCDKRYWTNWSGRKLCSRTCAGKTRSQKAKQRQINYSFEELYPIYQKAAKWIAYKYSNHYQYEIDELINEAWIKGSAKYATNKNMAIGNARKDMIIYVWSYIGQPRKMGGKYIHNSKKFLVNHPLKLGEKGKNGEHLELKSKCFGGTQAIDNLDEIDDIFNKAPLTRYEKLILKLRYLGGFDCNEIARIIGYSKEYIYILHGKALKALEEYLSPTKEWIAEVA